MRALLAIALALLASAAHADATQVCVIVAESSSEIRRVIVPDDDAQAAAACPILPGEALLMVDRDAEITAAVAKATGIAPPVPLAAVVRPDGTVDRLIVANPDLDTVPDGDVVQAYEGVEPRQTFDAKTQRFIRPVVQVPVKAGDTLADGSVAKTDGLVREGGDAVAIPAERKLQAPMTLRSLEKAARQ